MNVQQLNSNHSYLHYKTLNFVFYLLETNKKHSGVLSFAPAEPNTNMNIKLLYYRACNFVEDVA